MTPVASRSIPKPTGPDPAIVLSLLKSCESTLRLKILSALIGGFLLALVGPAFFTGLLWLRAARDGYPFDFVKTAALVCLIALPILILMAAKMPGSILESAAESGVMDNRSSRSNNSKACSHFYFSTTWPTSPNRETACG